MSSWGRDGIALGWCGAVMVWGRAAGSYAQPGAGDGHAAWSTTLVPMQRDAAGSEGSMVLTPKSWGSRGQDRAEGPCPSQPQSEGSGTCSMAVRDQGTTHCWLLAASTSQTPVP